MPLAPCGVPHACSRVLDCWAGKLYHPVATIATEPREGGPPRRTRLELLALVDSRAAEAVLEFVCCAEADPVTAKAHGRSSATTHSGFAVTDPLTAAVMPLRHVRHPQTLLRCHR